MKKTYYYVRSDPFKIHNFRKNQSLKLFILYNIFSRYKKIFFSIFLVFYSYELYVLSIWNLDNQSIVYKHLSGYHSTPLI